MTKYPLIHNYLHPNGKGIVITKAYTITIVVKGITYNIDIPVGFFSDLASIPPKLRSLIPQMGIYNHAVIVHDICYDRQLYPRRTCDLIMNEIMKELGVKDRTRRLMYVGVRIGGKYFYEN